MTTQPRADLTDLMMCSLNAPTWTARKLDKKITAEVKKANGVQDTTNAGNFNKLLLPECKELDAVASHIGAVRNAFYLRTAPWGDARVLRAVKAEDVLDLRHWFGDEKAKLKPLLAAFGAAYPAAIELAIYDLHGMGNRSDYPDWDVVERKFNLHLSIVPMPNKADIRLLTKIPAHVRQEIEDEITRNFAEVQKLSVANAIEPLLEKLVHMTKTLKGYNAGEVKRLYASLTENVQVMAEAAKRLNISRDPVVDALADEAITLVADVTQEDLKGSDGLRAAKAKAAEALAAKFGALMV